MRTFILSKNTKINCESLQGIKRILPVEKAVLRFERDMDMTLTDTEQAEENEIVLVYKNMPEETYKIHVQEKKIEIFAGEELGFIYALLEISRQYLDIHPFWFWNDWKFEKKAFVVIPEGEICSTPYRVRFRGWFINDEVLISHWDAGVDTVFPWEMAFEALLRLGGNMVIPGTDKNSKIYAGLASDMGLWITHHHAEPLGAEMFARAYPEIEPSFQKYPQLFRKLWQEGIEKQKGQKIIWNIGFRGQGDCPFWNTDPTYDTAEKRGELISSILKEQYNMVKESDADAVFCTNLYGEIMELYQQGVIDVPDDIIMIWADNGYGKMVSRRQENHNPRISAIPPEALKDKNHGTYYHVSFYDLQAANHITMLPNAMEFVEKELNYAYDCGIQQFWLINSSNVKPHAYPLDFIANLWKENAVSAKEHRKAYVEEYYTDNENLVEKRCKCIEDYPKCTAVFGKHEDEHAGEQFYNYLTRYFAHTWMKTGMETPCEALNWCATMKTLKEQILWYKEVCMESEEKFSVLFKDCMDAAGDSVLWEDSVLLQTKIHMLCLQGAVAFCTAYEKAAEGNLLNTFYFLGKAADNYEKADCAMREREHDKWKDFYANDCLTDIKETAHLLRILMGYVRNIGDGPDFYLWQREVTYSEEDKRVVLITNMENHMTDTALYAYMKENCVDRFEK
ncbi:MAG: glycosyl hydrolase 115 family protein [Lachnospiraceae bacterium]|nr:glycosyl hydrolase 115 family protein [Lachnospiraceae bacterium]